MPAPLDQRLLLVGEAPTENLREADPTTWGSRLRLAKWADLDAADLPRLARWTNLLEHPQPRVGEGRAFPPGTARARAMAMLPLVLQRPATILLGRRVARAFGLGRQPWFAWWPVTTRERLNGGPLRALAARARPEFPRVAILPHPSGASHAWNDPTVRRVAGEFLRRAVERGLAGQPGWWLPLE